MSGETETLTVVDEVGYLVVVRVASTGKFSVRDWDYDYEAEDVQASRTPSVYGPGISDFATEAEASAWAQGYTHGAEDNR